MSWEAAPTGKRGRQQTYSDTAIQTYLTMKVLFGMALRQTTGFVESLLRLADLNWTVPDFSTLSRRQKTLAVDIPYRCSKGPLHLLITVGTAVIAMLVFAAATQGYFFARSRWYESLTLLLVCFTLSRPGFWMDMIHPPFDEVKGERMSQLIADAPADTGKRVWIEGLNLNGDEIKKGVLIPLGALGDVKARLANSGLTAMADGDNLMVVAVKFGSKAEKLGIEQSFRITSLEVPADRPAKERFFLPAFLLLGLVILIQRTRVRRKTAAA